jgi:ring-1,2-phenylacetyl-CoA epoxidase subunit PaaC
MTGRPNGGQAAEFAWSDDDVRRDARTLLLALADSKRLLGIRYSDCMLGSPSLETGIAAASMAQDEWGHSRLTYALLSDFGDDPKQLEHGRESAEYLSIDALDRPFDSYAEMMGAALLVDGALTVQYEALADSRYTPVRNRVQKLLEEEVLHEHFAVAWGQRLVESRMRDEYAACLDALLPHALRWFGRSGAGSGPEPLVREGIVRAGPDELRAALLARVGPPLASFGLTDALGLGTTDSGWRYERELDWTAWDPDRRRTDLGGPDPDALARVRGDRNRAMLVE